MQNPVSILLKVRMPSEEQRCTCWHMCMSCFKELEAVKSDLGKRITICYIEIKRICNKHQKYVIWWQFILRVSH